MKRLTLVAILALFAFLGLWAWCHFGHSAPTNSRGFAVTESTGLDATQLTAIIGSIISALVALLTGFQNLVAMFKRKPSDETPVSSA